MTSTEAASLLGISPDAKPEQIEARFLEFRAKLEDRLAKAPTPGLKDKYRRSLEELVTAFEHLMLSADGSSLPVLQRVAELKAETRAPFPMPAATPATAGAAPAPAAPVQPQRKTRKPANFEFIIVAVVAVLVLGAGGWWVMKTRAENAERARLEAEAEAQAQVEAERVAAAEQAEQERKTRLAAELRAALAESSLLWEAAERTERDADRALSDLRSERRSLRDATRTQVAELELRQASAQRYAYWLRETLLQHPSKIARAKIEALLQSGAVDDAAAEMEALRASNGALQEALALTRNGETNLNISTDLPGVDWELVDELGRSRRGRASSRVPGLLFARYTLTARLPLFPDQVKRLQFEPGEEVSASFSHPHGIVQLESVRTGIKLEVNGQPIAASPRDPLRLPPGSHRIGLRGPSIAPWGTLATVREGETTRLLPRLYSPRSSSAVVDAFFAEHDVNFHWNRSLLEMAHLAWHRTGGATPAKRVEKHLELARQAWDRKVQLSTRISNVLDEAVIVRFLDPEAIRPLIEEAVETYAATPLKSRGTSFSLGAHHSWISYPDLARRFLREAEKYLPNESGYRKHESAKSIAFGWSLIGEASESQRWQEEFLGGIPADDERREATEKFFAELPEGASAVRTWDSFASAVARFDLDAMERFVADEANRELRVSQGVLAILVANGQHRTAINYGAPAPYIRTPPRMHGPGRLLTPLSYTRLHDLFVQMGRLDLLEEWARSTRASRPVAMAEAAAVLAVAGEKRRALALVDEVGKMIAYTHMAVSNNSLLSWMAVAQLVAEDREGAAKTLDRIGTAFLNKQGSFRSYAGRIRAVAAGLDKRDLVRQIDEAFPDVTPLDRLAGLVYTGDFEAGMAAAPKNNGIATLNAYAAMLLAPDGLERIPTPADAVQRSALAAALIARLPEPRRNQRQFAGLVPDRVEAGIVVEGIKYFPRSQSQQGIDTGKAKVRIEVKADGSIGEITTVEASHPDFGEQLTAAMRRSTFAPRLESGRPVDSFLEIERSFKWSGR